MIKSHKFNELSDKVCDVKGCNKKLKARLVEGREPKNITKCYGHYLVMSYRAGKDRIGNRKDRVRFIPGVV